jgi:sugar phosphate isomerase/epimerase
MPRLSIGITLETLGQPLRTAVVTAARAGVQSVVFDAVGSLSPDQLGETGQREVRHLAKTNNLTIAALRAPLRRGLEELDGLEVRMDRLRKAMDLAFQLGPRLLLLGIGTIPAREDDPVRQRMKTALSELARHGDRMGCRIALDAGLELPEVLRDFLKSFDAGSLGVSVDPAMLLMEKLPVDDTVRTLSRLVLHSYARDAVPRRIDRPAREVPLGSGDIDWFSWLGVLEEIGYTGPLTIRQAPFAQPLQEATQAVQFLRRLGVGGAI